MTITFLTFTNTNYMSSDRIKKQAEEFKIFDNILGMTELDIPEFIKKHEQFINYYKPGYGYWIWKPKIILDKLLKLNENDILIYCDAGMYFNINGKDRLLEYLNKLDDKISLVTFSANDNYKAQNFVKSDAVMNFYPNFNNELTNCCYAGLMIIKKNQDTINLISEWLQLCENYHYLDHSPSNQYRESPIFCGNDCDNGLFNLCLAKYKISHAIYPDEINLYSEDGKQLHHTDINPKEINWDSLKDFPFQCRRMTPKFGFN